VCVCERESKAMCACVYVHQLLCMCLFEDLCVHAFGQLQHVCACFSVYGHICISLVAVTGWISWVRQRMTLSRCCWWMCQTRDVGCGCVWRASTRKLQKPLQNNQKMHWMRMFEDEEVSIASALVSHLKGGSRVKRFTTTDLSYPMLLGRCVQTKGIKIYISYWLTSVSHGGRKHCEPWSLSCFFKISRLALEGTFVSSHTDGHDCVRTHTHTHTHTYTYLTLLIHAATMYESIISSFRKRCPTKGHLTCCLSCMYIIQVSVNAGNYLLHNLVSCKTSN